MSADDEPLGPDSRTATAGLSVSAPSPFRLPKITGLPLGFLIVPD